MVLPKAGLNGLLTLQTTLEGRLRFAAKINHEGGEL